MSKLLYSIASSIEGTLVLGVTCLILLFLLVSRTSTKQTTIELPETAVQTQEAAPLKSSDPLPTYTTNPPSSGVYSPVGVREGIYTSPLANPQIVYALKMGWIVMAYNCQYKSMLPSPFPKDSPTKFANTPLESIKKEDGVNTMEALLQKTNERNRMCGDTVSKLRSITNEKGTKKLILVPKSDLDSRIAVIAWGQLLKSNYVDTMVISKFIDTYRGRKIL